MPGGKREFFPSWGVASRTNEKGPAIISTILPSKAQAIMSRLGIGRRSRSKVWIRVVGAFLIGWVEVLEAWGAEVETVVVDPPDPFKHIRGLVSTTDTPSLLPMPTGCFCQGRGMDVWSPTLLHLRTPLLQPASSNDGDRPLSSYLSMHHCLGMTH